jgi:DNA-binding response OmpR family regulator
MPEYKFLVIEDDLFYRTYVDDLLADLDVEIISASDGETGLALAVSEKPDLIITDIEIPKIQGFVLLRNIRERHETSDIPVILMSGKVEKDLLERHRKLRDHADGYLLKPFSGQDLMDLVEKILGIRPGPGCSAERQEKEEDTENTTGGRHRQEKIVKKDEVGFDVAATERLRRALVVDDSRYICDIAGDYLKEIGFTVRFALDGEEGLKEALDFIPDLVLLDVQMPKMNGFVVCETLRKKEPTRNAVIILMSAVVDGETFERNAKLRYHADAYLQKPFMKSELQDLVSRLLPPAGKVESGLESKTGFLIPSEDEMVGAPGATVAQQPEKAADLEELDEVKSAFESLLKENEAVKSDGEKKVTVLSADLEELKGENAALVSKVESLESDMEALREQTRRMVEEAETAVTPRDQNEELERECRELRRDLVAALSAKNEIEDQVKYILEKRESDGSDQDLRRKLEEENAGLSLELKEKDERIGVLETELDAAGKAAASGVTEKEVLQRRIEAADGEIGILQRQLAEARAELGKQGDRASAGRILEEELKGERDLRIRAEAEVGMLQSRIEEFSGIEGRFSDLAKRNVDLETALHKSEKLRGELELSLGELTDGDRKQNGEDAEKLSERLDKLESALNQTVLEAQSIIDQQNAREYQLEENMKSLMTSVQEDREAFKEEKERWRSREEELRTAFEEALAENRRIVGEETAKLYPMLLPKRSRPLEVVTGTRRYWVAAAMTVLLVAVFILGYLVLSRRGESPRTTSVPGEIEGKTEAGVINATVLPIPHVLSSGRSSSYGDIWRQQTVQSVSDEMMIQATLHTMEELETAIMYTAEKEEWSRQRRERVLRGLMDTCKMDDYYCITVFSNNLRLVIYDVEVV